MQWHPHGFYGHGRTTRQHQLFATKPSCLSQAFVLSYAMNSLERIRAQGIERMKKEDKANMWAPHVSISQQHTSMDLDPFRLALRQEHRLRI